jgi:hypothetical protein
LKKYDSNKRKEKRKLACIILVSVGSNAVMNVSKAIPLTGREGA